MQDLYSDRVMEIGRENNGFYLLKENITVAATGLFMNKGAESELWHLRTYAFQLMSEVGLAGAKSISIPIELNQKLTTVEYDKHAGVNRDEELEDIGSYQRLIGKLLYLTITIPDLSFTVQVLSQFMQHPKQSHWNAVLQVVRYVKAAPGLGILLGTGPIDTLSTYYDSNRASCPNTRRSITGYVIKLEDSLLSWKSKKQQTVSQSSTKAEYRSLAAAATEITWFLGLLKKLQVDI
uniref:Uncharacterized mitochondrial protein AtMg00810-like n=1 Tax=Nicotiana tabacum TaxID=4097 RepID=A0A1S4DPS2_TOBAC|nr:PREDICTED: uncharacterized mitochondrial protein AtMg00810-like [Nicotiana tabacum]